MEPLLVFILLKKPLTTCPYFHFPRDSYWFTGCTLDAYWSKVPAPVQYVIGIGRSLLESRGEMYKLFQCYQKFYCLYSQKSI
jgi:hypothetical protein